MTELYAWAIPANAVGRWADHTWVTSFDTTGAPYGSLDEVAAHHEWLWMCWGSFHPKGGAPSHPSGLLRSADGRLNLARCLVTPNADSVHVPAARGTVQLYGIEGVCHQLANQVLLATRGAKPAISVKGARGYLKSVYIYGQYGLAHGAWRNKVRACHAELGTEEKLLAMADDVEKRAREILVNRDELFSSLMAMRHAYQARLLEQRGVADLSAEDLDQQHREHLAAVTELIGRERFQAIFEQNPEDEMNLVDPKMLAESRVPPPPAGD